MCLINIFLDLLQSNWFNLNGNFSSRINVLIRQPSNSDLAWDRYVTPFSYGMWLAVAITVCVLGVCLAVTSYGYERKQNLKIFATFLSIHACFCQQGESYRSYFTPSLPPYILYHVLWFHFIIVLRLNLSSQFTLSFQILTSIFFYFSLSILLHSSFCSKTKKDIHRCYRQCLSMFGFAASEIWNNYNPIRIICYVTPTTGNAILKFFIYICL
jgi:hypothetical protein